MLFKGSTFDAFSGHTLGRMLIKKERTRIRYQISTYICTLIVT